MGMTMQEATLVTWLRPDGAAVEVGEPIFVLATDKLEAEVDAEMAGTLRHAVAPGVTLPVGGVLGWLLSDERDPVPLATA
jgi:pyruvate/2-oxoglutarate dehydrogenase complex dihydrolipoamide acyltransferase (E2) component